MADRDLPGLAAYIRLQRGQLRWKQGVLASMAGVSLSTVQRVERGDPVGRSAYEGIASALGLDRDTFTRPRPVLDDEQQRQWLRQVFDWMEARVPVTVAPFRTERQLRTLAATHLAVLDSDLGEIAAEDLAGLREWIDLAGFMRGSAEGFFRPPPERDFRVRQLYGDVFEHVADMERRHRAVCLVGIYTAQTAVPLLPEAEVAVLALRSRDLNPAAAKLSTLFAERSIPAGAVAWDV